jgi:formylglycine-generating enzyme required for sulfatase activity
MKRLFFGALLLALAISVPIATMAQVTSPLLEGSLKDSVTGMEFVFIKGGCFQMGDTFGDGYGSEKPVHQVCVDDFYMGKYEVTQGQWETVMGANPSYFKGCGSNCPVESVSWNDVQEFISRLNQRSGKRYRLPTEAEWEYAARSGGKAEKWSGTSSEGELGQYAWYFGNAGGRTHPVGEKRPNGLGLYDMTGNVWEWCSDWYGENYYQNSPRNNPEGPGNGASRVLRGGSWYYGSPRGVRASNRGRLDPTLRYADDGFRLGVSAQ